MEVIRFISLAADGPVFFFPFIFQAKTLVLRSKRREMPPENLLPLLLTMDIDRAGACWQGSG